MNFLFKAVVWFCLLINVMQQCIAKHERTFSTPQFIQQSISITDDLESKKNDPLLVIVLMVKDEQDFMQPTLQPYVDAGIKNFFIFDTKSTDSTVEVTREFFKKNNIERGVIKEEAFVNFAVSRSRALELAEEAFPEAAFFLMIDSEWYMHDVQGLIEFCQIHASDDETPLYLVRIMNDFFDNYTPRLFRRSAHIRFVGEIHEVPNWWTYSELYKKVQPSVYFEWRVSKYGHEKSKRRYLRDREILLKQCEENPLDARACYYLAQTYHCLDDLENACKWYAKRIQLNQYGWDEENFAAMYHLAHVYNEMGNQDQAILKYLEAHAMRPHRAEPLVCLADIFWSKGQPALCYLFASRAVKIPYPENDLLFIDKKLYDYTRHDLLGIGSWYVGEHEEGLEAVLEALKKNPTAPHLHRNLLLHQEHCAQK